MGPAARMDGDGVDHGDASSGEDERPPTRRSRSQGWKYPDLAGYARRWVMRAATSATEVVTW